MRRTSCRVEKRACCSLGEGRGRVSRWCEATSCVYSTERKIKKEIKDGGSASFFALNEFEKCRGWRSSGETTDLLRCSLRPKYFPHPSTSQRNTFPFPPRREATSVGLEGTCLPLDRLFSPFTGTGLGILDGRAVGLVVFRRGLMGGLERVSVVLEVRPVDERPTGVEVLATGGRGGTRFEPPSE